MQRDDASVRFPLGSSIPTFRLKNVDGNLLGIDYFAGSKAGLVVFSCNHCPYVKGSEARLIEIVRRLAPKGLKALCISANDALKYPEDSFECMQHKSKELALPYPYLYDETQEVARQFDAACTPEAFLFDAQGVLVYHGALNSNPRDPAAESVDYLTPAIEAVLAGRNPSPGFIHPLGCSIKWK